MDNHVHFILYGTILQCKEFITRYKHLTGKWIRTKYGESAYMKHLPTQIIAISSEEQLLDTIAYIDRNSITAGFRYLPSEYPCGSARYMFRSTSQHDGISTTIDSLSKVERQKLLKTWVELPDKWRIDNRYMIFPEDFLNMSKLEKIFKSPARYMYHLSKKLEGKIELEQGIQAFISDKELRIITIQISSRLFENPNPSTLDFNSKIIIARKLRYDYASTPKQISRMLNIDAETLSKFI